MKKIQIIGNLVSDSTIYNPPSGNKVAINFTTAVNKRYKDEKGNDVNDVFYVSCSYWRDKNNIKVFDYLKKGVQVFILGDPDVQVYKNKENEYVAQQKITVHELELLSSYKKDGQQTSISNDDDNGDLPF